MVAKRARQRAAPHPRERKQKRTIDRGGETGPLAHAISARLHKHYPDRNSTHSQPPISSWIESDIKEVVCVHTNEFVW